MLQRLNLAQKTLLLVSVPLVFQLFCVVGLYSALSDIEAQAEEIENARVIVTHMNRVLRSGMDLVGNTRISTMTGKHIPHEVIIEEMRGEIEFLTRKLANKPDQRKLLNQLRNDLQRGERQAKRVKELIRNGDLLAARQITRESRALLEDFRTTFESIRVHQEAIEDKAPRLVMRRRELIRSILIFGVSFNIWLAVALAVLVQRGLVTRLQILSENANLFKEHKELKPPVGGSDEIARVDETFREMAATLAIAREYERMEATRLRQMIEGIPFGLAMLDTDGSMIMANSTLSRMLGFDSGDLAGTPIVRFFLTEKSLQSAAEKKKLIIQRKDGSEFHAEIGITEIATSDGPVNLMVLVDITERIELEQIKQQFVAVVSHELRTPLSTVDNYLEMLKRNMYGELSEAGHERLSGVQTSVERLIKLTTQLLDAERLESGTLTMEIKEAEISSILKQAKQAVLGPAEAADVSIEIEDCQLSIEADQERIVQVVVNLLSNAIKFSPEGGVVRLAVEKGPHQVRVEVADQGPGIPPGFEKRIFDRFQQVSIDDSRKRGGAGLGLAISQAIVEQHGGTIGVESAVKNGCRCGSIFWFTLPIKREEKSAQAGHV